LEETHSQFISQFLKIGILNAMVYNLERRKKCSKERTDKRTMRVPFTRDWLEKGNP
jgi:hypothetical protein